MSQPLVPPIGKTVDLREYDPDRSNGMSREEALAAIAPLRARLNELQDLLYADRRVAVLVVLQGIDTAGKDGTVRSVFQEVGPLGCSVVSFGVPSAQESAHDYLWRVHQHAPERGKLVVFNRSHYESVLVERVHGLVPKETWKRRYDEINAFERMLTAEGTVIIKFFLHISKDEQRERLQERVDNPKKHWKFRPDDIGERKHWDLYQEAFADMLTQCSTKHAPWHVVPADHKWYRDVVVARSLIARLEELNLRYPPAAAGVAGTKVE